MFGRATIRLGIGPHSSFRFTWLAIGSIGLQGILCSIAGVLFLQLGCCFWYLANSMKALMHCGLFYASMPHPRSLYFLHITPWEAIASPSIGNTSGAPTGFNKFDAHLPVSCHLWGELGSHLAQCGLGWGLPPYQVASWCIQPFRHSRNWPKIGGLWPFLFLGRGAGSPSSTM